MPSDTICAVATPAGGSRRAIVRLSGPDAVSVAARLFVPDEGSIESLAGYRLAAGRVMIQAAGGEMLSCRALLYLMRAPRSYTREDVAELHVPGSEPVLRSLLERSLELGCRAAGPGEFTRRAYLAGRITLAGVEAVLAAVTASSASELREAGALLAGGASARLGSALAEITRALAEVEARIDFADIECETGRLRQPGAQMSRQVGTCATGSPGRSRRKEDSSRERCLGLGAGLRRLAARLGGEAESSRGRLSSAARLRIAVVGAPNAGKSSLFNVMLGRPRALVSAAPGTTTDCVEAECALGGAPVTLLDTAGIGERPAEGLMRLAAESSLRFVRTAEMALLVADSSAPALPPELMRALAGSGGTTVWLVMSKTDLAPAGERMDEVARRMTFFGVPPAWRVAVSSVTGEGVAVLAAKVGEAFSRGELRLGSEGVVLGAASAAACEQAARSLEAAAGALDRGSDEIAAFELREAAESVSLLSGGARPYELADSVLDELFSRFCVGK